MERYVMIKAEITMPFKTTIEDREHVEFLLQESSWCASNIIDTIQELIEKNSGCLCDFINIEYLREADEIDAKKFKLGVPDGPT